MHNQYKVHAIGANNYPYPLIWIKIHIVPAQQLVYAMYWLLGGLIAGMCYLSKGINLLMYAQIHCIYTVSTRHLRRWIAPTKSSVRAIG